MQLRKQHVFETGGATRGVVTYAAFIVWLKKCPRLCGAAETNGRENIAGFKFDFVRCGTAYVIGTNRYAGCGVVGIYEYGAGEGRVGRNLKLFHAFIERRRTEKRRDCGLLSEGRTIKRRTSISVWLVRNKKFVRERLGIHIGKGYRVRSLNSVQRFR